MVNPINLSTKDNYNAHARLEGFTVGNRPGQNAPGGIAMPINVVDSYSLKAPQAKEIILRGIREGKTVAQCMAIVGKSEQTYEYYRKTDQEFKNSVEFIRAKIAHKGPQNTVPDFPEFSEEYLGQRMFRHQLQWLDLLEGRKPRERHPNIIYKPGEPDLIIANTPPEHAKSTTLTVNYVTWRICQDPNIRVIIVSRTQTFAKKFLTQIKGRLTHPKFARMQRDFGPVEGYDANSISWTADLIYISDDLRDSGEKDPTVQALGIRGQIYGARADLIILDDCVDGTNAHEFDKQIDWIQGEVMSRLTPSGRLVVVGTRMAPVDLYSELQNPAYYPDETSPWTYFAQPAVLEFADDSADWVTLWPRSNNPEIGARPEMLIQDENLCYPKWDGPRLAQRRARMNPRKWAMVYMQQQVVDNSTFPQEAVNGCVENERPAGLMHPQAPGGRAEGMAGLYVLAGLDPAMSGNTAAIVYAVDRTTRKRWVLDVFNGQTNPDDIRTLIRDWTTKYAIVEWRVEKNSFQIMLTQDREIRQFLQGRGCILKEHFTGSGKWDTGFGVASMRDLFGTWAKVNAGWKPTLEPLISLPSRRDNEGVKALIEQLVTWYPEAPKNQKTDTVMALWFCEIRARELTDEGYGKNWLDNPYMPPRMDERRSVIDLDSYFMESQTPNVGSL